MFREQSQVRHLSWEEVNTYVQSLASMINTDGLIGIRPLDPYTDSIPAAILAYNLKLPLLQNGGKCFSVYSDISVDYCLFKKEYPSDHYNNSTNYYVDVVKVDEEGNYQQITFPWKK